jgi:hypothetical protein
MSDLSGNPGPKELMMPPGAQTTAGATEVLRAWIVDRGLEMSIISAFDRPDTWGLLLADVARHAARSYAMDGICSQQEALDRILTMFDAEMGQPTDLGTTEDMKKQ